MIWRAHFLVAVGVISCCSAIERGGHDINYRSAGEALCVQLFHDESVYVRSARATDTGVDQLYGRFQERAHGLPRPPPSLPGPILNLDRAMRSAHAAVGDAAGPLWQLIGAARAEGLWRCGSGAVAALRRNSDAVRLGQAKPDRATYLSELQILINDFNTKHQAYHAHPDPVEQRQRLPDDHGPGFLALQRDFEAKVEQLGAPPNDEGGVRTLLAFFREAIARQAAGIATGGRHGTALFESGFASDGELGGATCLRFDLCN